MTKISSAISRRTALQGAVALPFIGGLAASATRARAATEMKGAAMSPYNRFKLGGFEVTALLAGSRTVPDPHGIFGLNVSEEEFSAVSQANHIPADKAQFFFTPTLVNTGSELVLFDTGLNGAGITGALSAAGYTPDQIDTVVLTHMHGDHIGGLSTEGAPTFANARYVASSVEYDHWAGAGNDGFEANVRPLTEKIGFVEDGASLASGITALPTPGHTPGHMGFMIESDGQQLALAADLANHYVWSLANPDWEVKFDMDKGQAAASRRSMLDMLATDKVPMIGYHMPWPAMGYVETRDQGFHYVPASYQLMLE